MCKGEDLASWRPHHQPGGPGEVINQQMYFTTYWDISVKKQPKIPTCSGERGEQTKQNKNQSMGNNIVWMEEGDRQVLG